LFILIVLGAYSEFHAPGVSIPGAVALVSLVLYLGAPYLAGFTVTWEIVAVLLGFVLLALEVFVIPGFGIAGISGLLLIALGFIASFVPQEPGYGQWTPHWPELPGSYTYLRNGLLSLAGGSVGSLIGMIALARFLPRIPLFGRVVLRNPTREQVIPEDPYAALANLGDIGLAESLLRPAGKVRFGATLLDVVSEGEYIPRGSRVEVVRRDAGRVVVRRID
jgi:membrane-bound serine protease (ClpP class)